MMTIAPATSFRHHDIAAAARRHGRAIGELPYVLRILLENLERQRVDDPASVVTEADIAACVRFESNQGRGLALKVARAILPDSSGIPVLQSLASLRSALAEAGGDPLDVRLRIPCDLIVDHSLQVDHAGIPGAAALNRAREFERNGERYRFLRWAEQGFEGLRVFPPGTGIIHQVNMEYVARVVMRETGEDGVLAYPDFVLGGDSHTPMVNGIGVLGWGVGGIDIEAALLGLPYDFPLPEPVGVHLSGRMRQGTTTTDLVLHLTQRLRSEGVVAAAVEYFGEAAEALSVPERCTLANMAPEYGATVGYFPIDRRTIGFLRQSRGDDEADFVEAYARRNSLFREAGEPAPRYRRVIELDLGDVVPSVAGPRRPQDRLDLDAVSTDFRRRLDLAPGEGGFGAAPGVDHGRIAIAAITSCTNTSNPSVMLAAGLLARRAVAAGLRVPAHVKTSLAPGSRAVTRYLHETGLMEPLEALGFHVIGYGCTTCAGKSGPLVPAMEADVTASGAVAAAVLSGNRNFEGRIHRLVRANYIMSPALVVAYALAGRIDVDFRTTPLGHTDDGRAVYLADLWPDPAELAESLIAASKPDLITSTYADHSARAEWDAQAHPRGPLYPWEAGSSFLRRAPFFDEAARGAATGLPDTIAGARALGLFGDTLTTDHISPGGEIPEDSAAGRHLLAQGIARRDFNTYVGRRGNHEVMIRATFANLRIRNLLVDGVEGGQTRYFADDDDTVGKVMPIDEAAALYRARGVPAVVLAGADYGTGSSRDWAAKGTALLGVRAVIAGGFERIHRVNLIGMGVVPLAFAPGESWQSLGLDGTETFRITGLARAVAETLPVEVEARRPGHSVRFHAVPAVATASERRLLASGGIAPLVWRQFSNPRPAGQPAAAPHDP